MIYIPQFFRRVALRRDRIHLLEGRAPSRPADARFTFPSQTVSTERNPPQETHAASANVGSAIVNVLPLFNWDCTVIAPPCRRTTSCAKVKPRPVPVIFPTRGSV